MFSQSIIDTVETPVVRRRTLNRKSVLGWSLLLLSLFYILVYLLPLSVRPMIRPDEFRYAEIPREMLESHDWVSPRLLGLRYFEKPALGYQLTALTFSMLGENRFALRLPSALATGFTALAIFWLLALRTRQAWLPLLGSGFYLTFGLVFGIGTFAVLDSQLTAALTGCMVALYLSHTSVTRAPSKWLWLAVAGAMAGLAFLLKGFLGFAIPALVWVPFLWWEGVRKISWRAVGLFGAIALLVAMPWSLAIHVREADFWRYFIQVEHLQRFTSQTIDRSPQPVWYFIPVLLLGILPSGVLFGVTRGVWDRRTFQIPLVRFAVCWFLLPFLFFSASSCKLGTYILPCFPAVALLLAFGLMESLNRAQHHQIRAWLQRIGGGMVLLASFAWILWIFSPQDWSGSTFPQLTLLAFAIWGGSLYLLFPRSIFIHLCVFLFGIGPAIYFGLHALPTSWIGNTMPEQAMRNGFSQLRPQSDDYILVDNSSMQSVAWFLKRRDLIVVGGPGELEYPLSHYPEYRTRHYASWEEALKKTPDGKRIYISFKKKAYWPENTHVLVNASSKHTTLIRF